MMKKILILMLFLPGISFGGFPHYDKPLKPPKEERIIKKKVPKKETHKRIARAVAH